MRVISKLVTSIEMDQVAKTNQKKILTQIHTQKLKMKQVLVI